MSWRGRFWPWQLWAWYRKPPPVVVPPPPVARSPFAGIGLFTAQDARAALRGSGMADWVAVRPDLVAPAVLTELEEHFSVYFWQDVPTTAIAQLDRPYICQSEGPDQMAAAKAVEPFVPGAKALVGNEPYFLPAWTSLLECYQVAVPSDLGPGFPVLGVFDGFPLVNYIGSPRRDFSVYLAEGMTDADWNLLATLTAG